MQMMKTLLMLIATAMLVIGCFFFLPNCSSRTLWSAKGAKGSYSLIVRGESWISDGASVILVWNSPKGKRLCEYSVLTGLDAGVVNGFLKAEVDERKNTVYVYTQYKGAPWRIPFTMELGKSSFSDYVDIGRAQPVGQNSERSASP